jgi:Zn-dependent metalloprotease
MYTTSKFQRIMTAIVVFTMVFSAIGSTAVSAQDDDGVKRQVNDQNGKVSFIGPETGRVVPASRALGIFRRPQDPGMALAKQFGPDFGLKDPERDLSEIRTSRAQDGRVTVRYQQTYQGFPVIGGELIVNTNESGDLYSINGEVSPDLSLPTQPEIDSAQATQTALEAVATWYQKTPADFVTTEPELWIFDESLLQSSTRPVELVWRMEVTPRNIGMPVRELVLVNAQRDSISLHFNQVDMAWHSAGTSTGTDINTDTNTMPDNSGNAVLGSPLVNTYTANSLSSLPGNLLCNQSQPNCTSGVNLHADAAHKYAIGTYNLYATQHLRDSINGNGMTIISTVQYCNIDPAVPCPYGSAFWSGSQMVYGSKYGFALADDMVAHELTHGVTQYESNLFSYYQSGAIDESFSDLWGEYYDQTNGLGNDAANVKWLIGEDVSGLRVIRSMKNPPLYGDPDKMKSSLYQKNSGDNGGIHHNSGVNNKAVYLMVDGGTFNKKTVTALGWGKVGAIYYDVNTNLLTSGSDYSDLYYALQQACSNLIGQYGIIPSDCQEVKDALDAVQMNAPSAFNPEAPFCPSGTLTDPSLTLFEDDLESGLGNWSTSGLAWILSNGYASSGINMLWGRDAEPYTDSRATLTTGVPIPAGKTFLRFKHAYLFDSFVYQGTPRYYDGGVLEYSTDGGSVWKDAKPLFSAGKNYGGTLYQYSFNPLGGRQSFVGDSHGYVSSRYKLSSLAGKTVNFRWRLGTDQAVALKGWFVDDVQIYTCVPVPAIPTLQAPANDALVTNYTPLLDWSDVTPVLDHYQLQVATENTFEVPLYNVNTLVSEYQLPSVEPNTRYYWRVRSFNSLGFTLGWSKVRSFRAAMLRPVPTAPTDTALLTIRRPFFDWENVDGASGYKLVISKKADLSDPIRSVSVVNSEYLPTSDLPANMVLYWRVRATGPNGPSLWSVKRSFTTGNPPSVPALVLPANNALVKIYTPLVDWRDSTLPIDTTFRYYELQVDDNNDFSTPTIAITTTDDVITESSYTPLSDLASNTRYYWRVRAINDVAGVDHVSSWSKVFSFRTVILPPTLLSPANLSTVGDLKPVFDWNDASGPGAITNYIIQVSASPTFDVLLINSNPVDSTYTPGTNLPAGKTLYWRVRVNGANGPSTWSIFQFTTPP